MLATRLRDDSIERSLAHGYDAPSSRGRRVPDVTPVIEGARAETLADLSGREGL
jgi:hypothetical protein